MKPIIIVPCYNERDNIAAVYHEIREKTQYDVIFINDGSTDDSKDILQRENIPHLNIPLNLGIGGAVQTGYRFALRNGYDIAVQLDGDGQHDPAFIESLIEPIEQGKADLVIGSRFIANEGYQSSAIRRAGIKYFKALIYCLTFKVITDATSGFRALNRKTLQLFDNFYARDYPEPESNTLALRNKLRVLEIPVTMRARQGGTSSITGTRSIYYMVKVSIGIIISVIKPRVKE